MNILAGAIIIEKGMRHIKSKFLCNSDHLILHAAKLPQEHSGKNEHHQI